VTRAHGSTGSVSVNYATSDGTATAGSDYASTSGTLTFADGETSKTFTIPIINDTAVENRETVFLTLSNPTGGAALDAPATATLAIDSDDTTTVPVTATYQQGVNGYTGTTDVDFSNQYGGNGATNIDGDQLGVYQTTGSGAYTIEGLIRFDNLGITTHATTDATVTGASLTLTVDFGTSASTIRGYYLLAPWTIAPGTDLGWLRTGAGANWNTPGALGQGTDVIAGKSFVLPSVTGTQTVTVNLDPAVVQSWIDNPNADQGILLVNETTGAVVRVDASENATAAARPKLSVSYTVALSTFPGALQFSNSSYSVNENQGSVTVTVTRTSGSTGSVSVNYATSDGPATAGNDYVATSGTLTFADGETSKTFTIPIIDDNLVENNETFNLALSNPTGGAALGSPATASVTIIDNDVPQPGILQFSTSGYSVNENGGSATITVTRTGGSNVPVTVNYATSDGTATAGADYTATSGTLNFAIGETSKTFTVPITNDTLVEGNETVNLTLSSPTGGATLGSQTTAVLTVIDDDTSGTVAATYQQGLNGYTGTTDVSITTQNAQFTGGNGITTFDGSQLGLYQLTGNGAYTVEDLVRFSNLGIPASATVTGATLTLTVDSWIANPTIRGYYVLAPWSSTPGSNNTQVGWLHRGTGQDWATPGALGLGMDVIAGNTFVLSGIRAVGEQPITITLDPAVVQSWVNNPNADQGILLVNETPGAVVRLDTSEHPTAASRPKLTVTYNPVGTPGTLQFSNATYSVNENQGTVTVTVTRTGGSTGSVSVHYATSDGTATAGSDYTATSGTLTFADGETSKTFTIPILDDTLVEGNETVNLILSSPTGGAALGSQATATLTIVDDDVVQPGVLQFSTSGYSVNENGGSATITVTRTGGSNVSVTVHYATSDGTATAGSDYTAASGTLTFGVGEISKTFTVPILDDTLVEGNETVNLTLSNPTGGAALGNPTTATLTIVDDDVAQPGVLQFSAAAYSVNEPDGTATITVTRTGGSNVPVTVHYATSDGTATAGSDYTAVSGRLTFGVGETSKTFTVPITNDTLVEGNETVNLTLSSPTDGATLGNPTTATLTIVDDDVAQPGVLQFNTTAYSVNENQGTATITVTRTGGSNVPVSVHYATSDGTATAGADYTATSGTLNFAIGETSKTFTLPILNDTLVEGNETVNLTLSSPTGGATLGSPITATLTIVDDDTSSQPITVTLQQGVNGYTGTTDASISTQYAQYTGGNGTTTFNGTQLNVYQTTGTGSYTMESLIRFSALGIPANATVSAATLTLNVYTWSANPTIRGYYLLAPWSGTPGSSASQLGWLHRGTGQDWVTPGALGQGTDVVSGKTFVLPGITASGSQTITVTLDPAVVQSWVNNPNADQGILLVNQTPGAIVQVSASENATVASRPKLSVTYTVGTPTPQPGALQFSSPTYTVNENGGTATITVTRTGGSDGSITVHYATSDGTATAGSDYTATSGTLTFAAGETSKTFTVPIIDDTLVEGNETINLTLSTPTGGATLGTQTTAVLTILDNDVATLQSIDVTPVNPSIANGQTTQFTATGHYSDGTSHVLTSGVSWSSSNTSIATISSSGLALAVGAGSATITAVDGSVSSSTTLTVTAATGSPTVGAHTLAFTHFGAPAGTLSTNPIVTQASGSTVLAWLGRGQISTFTPATAPTDNHGNTSVQLGSTHSYAPLFPNSGMTLYAFQSFVGGSNDVFSAPMPVNDEVTLMVVEIKNGGVIQDAEWNSVANDPQTSLSVTTTGPATLVAFWTGDGASGAVSAVPDNGFTVLDSELESSDAVQASVATKDVSAAGTYNVTWSATPAQTAYMWLVAVQHGMPASQPGAIQFGSSNYGVNENQGTATITVTRTGGSDGAVAVHYATSDGTAMAGSDYTATSGTLTFAAGETSKTFTVPITDDTLVEGNETVNLTLTSPTGGATLGSPTSATLTIIDNDAAPTGMFTNVTDSSGISAIIAQKYQEDPNWWLSGEHLVDLDNDGDLDLFLDAHNGTSVVALNDGHGHFTRVTTGSWPSTEIHEMFDINGDGKVDLNATFQDGGSQWWINHSTPGVVNFTPTTVTRDTNTARSQVMMDFNHDGKVDWLRSAPPGLVVDFGDGNGGFTEDSLTFPIAGTDSNDNASFLPADFDGDGNIDLLVLVGGNYDGTPGKTLLWHNNGNMTFTDVTATSGIPANGTIAKGIGDFNQDGHTDFIAIENKSMPPVIYLNDGHGHFTFKPNAISGVAAGSLDYTSWGTAVTTDFDNDGIPDIIMDGKYYLKVLRGTGGGNFTYMNTAWGILDTAAASLDDGLTFGDIDGDGRLDIIGYNETYPTRTLNVYHNDLAAQNWLNIRLAGLAGNVGAAGAKISIYAAGTNQLLWYEEVADYDFQVATSSYGYGQTERHYGLGTRTNVDVVVVFPSGRVTRINNVTANQTIQVLESAGS
jgi:urease beta subunit